MLTGKEFRSNVRKAREINGLIEAKQNEALIQGNFKFKIVVHKNDETLVKKIAVALGFDTFVCECNENIEVTFS